MKELVKSIKKEINDNNNLIFVMNFNNTRGKMHKKDLEVYNDILSINKGLEKALVLIKKLK